MQRVNCNSGDVATGGGYAYWPYDLRESYPYPTSGEPTGWEIVVSSPDDTLNTYNFVSYVVCIDLTPTVKAVITK